MKFRSVLTVVLVWIAVLGIAFASIGAGAREDVVIALPSEPTILEPVLGLCIFSLAVTRQIFEPLIWLDEKLSPTNRRLAVSWEIPDPLTYIFHLRRGVRFHDGHEMTAADVKFTLLANKDPALAPPRIADFEAIERIEIIDDHTIKVILSRPHAPFMVDAMTTGILPKHVVQAVGWDEFGRNPIGTGPYKFVEWRPGDFIELRRNEDYWGELANIETVKFRFILEPAVGVMAMKALDIDFLYNVPGDDWDALKKTPGVAVGVFLGLNFRYIGFNLTMEPFDDVRVRRAVNYAICIYLTVKLWYPFAVPATGPIPPYMWGYTDDVRRYNRDVEEAKRLLAEAGFPDGFDVTLTISPGTRAMEEAILYQVQLAEAGIRVTIHQVEWGLFLAKLMPGEGRPATIPMFRIGWTGMVDPWSYMEFLMTGSGWNWIGYSNPEFDKIMEEAVRTVDIERRKELLAEAQRILLEDVPYVFLFHEKRARAYNENLGGLVEWVEANGFGPLDEIYRWYWRGAPRE